MDSISSERRSANMRRIASQNTKPELMVRRFVHGLGYRYRLHVSDLPGKPDLVLSRHRLIIEIRGCFWHQHPGCLDSHIPKTRIDYWEPKLRRNVLRDKENMRKLKALGWQVVIVWECQSLKKAKLHNHLANVLSRFC